MLGENQIDGYEEGSEPLVFYHKNGEFRQYEDKKHSDLATGVTKVKPGLFKALVATKGNRFLLLTIAILAVFSIVYALVIFTDDSCVVKGVSASVSAFDYEETVYATVTLEKPKRNAIEGPRNVTVEMEVLSVEGQVIAKEEESFVFNNEKLYMRRMFTDYDIGTVKATLSLPGEKSMSIKTSVKRK